MKYIINIPKPCNEDWNKMTPTFMGRYCGVCKKEIFDFTKLTNRQLVDKLTNNENICARYRKNQLNIDLNSVENKGLKKVGFLVSLASIFSLSSPVYSQETVNPISISQKENKELQKFIEKYDKLGDSILIKGKVSDDVGPLPSVEIVLKGSKLGTETNFDGDFTIKVPKEIKDIVLVFSYIGMETKEIKITNKDKLLLVEMKSDPNQTLTGEVVVVKKNIFKSIGNLFRRKK